MRQPTNSLVAKMKKFAVPLGTTAAFLIATSFFLFGHTTTAMAATTAPVFTPCQRERGVAD